MTEDMFGAFICLSVITSLAFVFAWLFRSFVPFWTVFFIIVSVAQGTFVILLLCATYTDVRTELEEIRSKNSVLREAREFAMNEKERNASEMNEICQRLMKYLE